MYIQNSYKHKIPKYLVQGCFLFLKKCRRNTSRPPVAVFIAELRQISNYTVSFVAGLRVLSIAYVPDRAHSAFACVVAGGGEVADHLRLPHLLHRRNAWDALERQNKDADMTALRR